MLFAGVSNFTRAGAPVGASRAAVLAARAPAGHQRADRGRRPAGRVHARIARRRSGAPRPGPWRWCHERARGSVAVALALRCAAATASGPRAWSSSPPCSRSTRPGRRLPARSRSAGSRRSKTARTTRTSRPPSPLDDAAAARGRASSSRPTASPATVTEGRGDGPVSAKFPPAPNLRHDSICKRTDGFLYGTLTAGGRAMPTMREGTTSQDRWDLVAFVRLLQREGCTGRRRPPPAGGTP